MDEANEFKLTAASAAAIAGFLVSNLFVVRPTSVTVRVPARWCPAALLPRNDGGDGDNGVPEKKHADASAESLLIRSTAAIARDAEGEGEGEEIALEPVGLSTGAAPVSLTDDDDGEDESAKPMGFRGDGRVPFTLPLNYATVALPIALLLTATGVLPPSGFAAAVAGTPGSPLHPWAVLVLLASLSYVCVALDITGALEAVAVRVLARAGDDGRKVLLAVWLLTSAMTVATNNDVVILTLTPVLAHAAAHSGVDPARTRGLHLTQFYAANAISAVWYLSNPTNLVVAQAFALDPLRLAAVLAPAALASHVLLFASVAYWFPLPRKLPAVRGEEERVGPKDPRGAVVHGLVLAACIAALIVSTALTSASGEGKEPVPVWTIVLAAGLASLAWDLANDALRIAHFDLRPWPRTRAARSRFPLGIFPFLVGQFALVEALVATGALAPVARGLAWAAMVAGGGPLAAAVAVGCIAAALCAVMNNLPTTVLLVRAMQHPAWRDEVAGEGADGVHAAAVAALVLASNTGPCTALAGSLAGLLWAQVLKGLGVSEEVVPAVVPVVVGFFVLGATVAAAPGLLLGE
ncbi:hypothetical protein H9P43_005363 [Blastocladiella emersonii ATCC 22665]|nr:hypothetical protein H9P43_005363 [Blastocladiella emersonii ATCC 22665]